MSAEMQERFHLRSNHVWMRRLVTPVGAQLIPNLSDQMCEGVGEGVPGVVRLGFIEEKQGPLSCLDVRR